MKVLFSNKKSLVRLRGIAMLFVLQLSALAVSANAQNNMGRDWSNSKLLYGVHASYTLNDIDIYYTTSSLEKNLHSTYASGFRMAVIGEYLLGDYFSLRTMPGVSLLNTRWEPGEDVTAFTTTSNYKVESVLGEVPIDIKILPCRIGNWHPYLAVGLNYSFDFASLRKDSGNDYLKRLDAQDLRYTGSLGVDWYTNYLKIGFELKASYGLLQHSIGNNNSLYFHSAPTFSIGFNIEA